jgi:hypothetical protein
LLTKIGHSNPSLLHVLMQVLFSWLSRKSLVFPTNSEHFENAISPVWNPSPLTESWMHLF